MPFNVVTARFNLILGTSYNHDFQRELIKTKPFSRPVGCFSWAFLYIVVVVSPFFCFETKPQKKKLGPPLWDANKKPPNFLLLEEYFSFVRDLKHDSAKNKNLNYAVTLRSKKMVLRTFLRENIFINKYSIYNLGMHTFFIKWVANKKVIKSL